MRERSENTLNHFGGAEIFVGAPLAVHDNCEKRPSCLCLLNSIREVGHSTWPATWIRVYMMDIAIDIAWGGMRDTLAKHIRNKFHNAAWNVAKYCNGNRARDLLNVRKF